MNDQTLLKIIATALEGRHIDLLKEVEKLYVELRENGEHELAHLMAEKLKNINYNLTSIPEVLIHEGTADAGMPLHSGNYADYWDQLTNILPPDEATGQKQPEMHIKQFEFLVNECKLKTDELFLDIGCGSLRGTRLIVSYLNRGCFHGMDVSKKLLAYARQRVEKNPEMAEKEPKFADENRFRFSKIFPGIAYNFAFAKSVMTHLFPESIWDCLVQLRRVIKPEGVFYSTIFKDNKVNVYRGDTRKTWDNTEWLKETAELSGWSLDEIGETRVGQYMCLFRPI